ncbi:CHASE2 domain-containing protein [Microcoleus sp. FACHB-1515]|nr:CHASE2 domain-containing protein [Microcoleus sp. FACHB-1515]
MNQCVVLKFSGSFESGFTVTMQIGEDGSLPAIEITASLPANADLPQAYQNWRSSYRQFGSFRLNAPKAQKMNISLVADCRSTAQTLSDRLNAWLSHESFRPIREKWLEQLQPTDPLRILLQTEDPILQRLPWHEWDVIDRYRNAELALSLPNYERRGRSPSSPGIKILAILGSSDGINIEADRQLLAQLPDAEVCFLVEPARAELSDRLWSQAWDILFFAGHSFSTEDSAEGKLAINPLESLSIAELRYGLRKAIDRGLQLAIFNSCDGLGLARNLADLQIPQMIVMREPVPDRVAQTFLKSFLTAFSQGMPLYAAVREAREHLQGLESQFPCATWLPMLCQHPAIVPPTWHSLRGQSVRPARRPIAAVLLISLAVAAVTSAVRYAGMLQPIELWAFDRMLRSRPAEPIDSRLLIVGITEAEIQAQQGGSLSDATLDRVLTRLEPAKPRAIGLDLYRDFPVEPNQPRLADTVPGALRDRLQNTPNLIAVCKASDPENDITGVAPPPEVPIDRVGFSDFWEDADGVLRRQVLFMTPDPASPCATPYAFSTQLAFRYLHAEGITPRFTPEGNLQLGDRVLPRLAAHAGGYQGINAQGNQILINYRPKAAQVTLTQVLNGQVQPSAIRDRIVLIGVVSENSADIWATPYGTHPTQRMPGVTVQAQMISQILSAAIDRRPLIWVWHWTGDVLWIGVWAVVGGLIAIASLRNGIGWRGKSGLIAIGLGAIGLGIICFAVFCLQAGWLPFVPGLVAIGVANGVVTCYLNAPSRQPQ